MCSGFFSYYTMKLYIGIRTYSVYGQTVLMESGNFKVQLFWLNPSTRQGQTDVGATKPKEIIQIIVI